MEMEIEIGRVSDGSKNGTKMGQRNKLIIDNS